MLRRLVMAAQTQVLDEVEVDQGSIVYPLAWSGSTPTDPPISDDEVWAQTVSNRYKGRIYEMEISYSMSYFLGSVSGAGFAGTDSEAIRDQVHALNKSVQRQLTEGTWSYTNAIRETRSSEGSSYSLWAEDGDYVPILRVDAEQQFVIHCTTSAPASATSASTSTASPFSTRPPLWGRRRGRQ